ncbi:hypothetical protein H8E88_18260 [candidate division KSB1 bacterium]|nr:hypothetical protein [candidate division KSB1 bacterium]MBL7095223.1 hypothetical protein [candidate division KSB1 bacterium]
MQEGETNSFSLPPEKAYSIYNKELVFAFYIDNIKKITPKVGERYDLKLKNGNTLSMKVIKVENQKVIVDGNHDLAGKEIIYDIQLVKILN